MRERLIYSDPGLRDHVVRDATRFGILTSSAALAAGGAVVEKTIFFGLITTGTVVSPWLVAGYFAIGAVGGAGLSGGFHTLKLRAAWHEEQKLGLHGGTGA